MRWLAVKIGPCLTSWSSAFRLKICVISLTDAASSVADISSPLQHTGYLAQTVPSHDGRFYFGGEIDDHPAGHNPSGDSFYDPAGAGGR